ncbi:MAG: hypothetical protein ACK56K_16755 [Akkermansiaceae bacterium]|jgi:hypothetical protein
MKPSTKYLAGLFMTFTHILTIFQPAFAAENRVIERKVDVYPLPPQPPTDAFAPQWKAPKPTLTGKAKAPAAPDFVPAQPFTDFAEDATLQDIDSASLTHIPLESPKEKKRPLPQNLWVKTGF